MAEREPSRLRKVIEEELKPYQIIRSDRKTLAVLIDAFGRVVVRAPKRMSEERIFSFLRKKRAWILKHKARGIGKDITLPSENLDGFTFYLIGRWTTIRLYPGEKICFQSGFDGANDIVYLPQRDSRKRLVKWLKENAERIFSEAAERWARRMGISYPSLKITATKKCWASCMPDNALNFSFRLLYAPKETIEYVVVHELSHIFEKNHSKAFWAVVERYLPDYKKRREWLKLNRAVLQIF
ncbi:MAG: M48 family metallopeptidase [Clostridia bacterium]|nr:M48 family metallopeptidase [Clostridia bacterium]